MIVKALLGLIGVVAIAYVALCIALFFAQRSMIYLPPRGPFRFESDVIKLPTAAGDVLVSVRRRSGPNAVIYFGGNAEDVRESLPELAAAFPDDSLYLMNYRGYGGSAGKPTEQGLRQDALALFDLAQRAHRRVIIMGRSLGSGVAVWLASQQPPARLILVTPFNSLAEVAATQFPYLPLSWLMLDKYESWRYAPAVTSSTLILEAEHDEVIPKASTRALASHFRKDLARYVVVPGTQHNDISLHPDYVAMLRSAE